MNSKLICFLGAPSSGKSTLASMVHSELKRTGNNSIFVGESASDFIAEYGIPNSPMDQMIIFYKQLNRERMYIGNKEYIICDSSTILNYFYFRSLFSEMLTLKDIAAINHLQKEILKNINRWYKIFYVNPIVANIDDGIRFHNKEEILKLDIQIKSYLQIENIKYEDLSKIDLPKRVDYIINLI